jgi:hypothetical protein
MKNLFNAVGALVDISCDVQVATQKIFLERAKDWMSPLRDTLQDIREGYESSSLPAALKRAKKLHKEVLFSVDSATLENAQKGAEGIMREYNKLLKTFKASKRYEEESYEEDSYEDREVA